MLSLKDCGLMLEPQEKMSASEVVEWAVYAERNGYGYLFRSDHFLPCDTPVEFADAPECWTTLAMIAAKTSKLRFGPMVTPVGFRNPALLARMACTIHSFSGGRLRLGLGAGWYQKEYLTHGYGFPQLAARRTQLIEALRIIRPVSRGDRVDFDGGYFSAHFECLPKPAGRIHLIIGGKGASMARIASTYADELNVLRGPTELYSRLKSILESEGSGRNTVMSQMAPFFIGEKKSVLERKVKRYMKLFPQYVQSAGSGDAEKAVKELVGNNITCGVPDEFVAQLHKKREIGIQNFYLQLWDPSDREMVDTLTDTLKQKL